MDTVLANLTVASLIPSHHNMTYHLIVIIVAAVAAFIPRYFPMRFFTNRKIPDWFNEWMKYVPVSLFTALVVKALFVDGKYHYFFDHVTLMGSHVTRSMLLSVIVGLVAVWILTFII